MIQIFPKSLGAAGYIIILQLVIVAFFGLLFIGVQLQSIDVKQILLQNIETTNDTNEIISSGNRTSTIINEIREFGRVSEESRQNQTERLLPIFFRQFNQTDRIEDVAQNLTELLAQQRFTEKEIRDNQVAMAFDLDRLTAAVENLTKLVG